VLLLFLRCTLGQVGLDERLGDNVPLVFLWVRLYSLRAVEPQGPRTYIGVRGEGNMGRQSLALLKGTLDVLILKTLSDGPAHGYGISRWVREATGDSFSIEEGAMYPALRRLEKRGYVEAEWGVTDTGREARFYRLTAAGSTELASGVQTWERYVEAMSRVLGTSTA